MVCLFDSLKVKVTQSCPTLQPHFPFSRGSSRPRDRTAVSCIAGRFFTNWAIREALSCFKLQNQWCCIKCCCLFAKSCPTLLQPHDYSPLGSSVHGIFWARILSRLPGPSPGDFPNPGMELTSPAMAGRFFTTKPPGKPTVLYTGDNLDTARLIIEHAWTSKIYTRFFHHHWLSRVLTAPIQLHMLTSLTRFTNSRT